jgi:hypothetical protein
MTDRDQVREALRLIGERVTELVAKHPHGHLPPAERDHIELRVRLPLSGAGADLEETARALDETLDRAVEDALARAAAFEPGRVLCLRCGTARCEHGAPRGGREVFVGYSPTGTPRFVDFSQLLLDVHHPRIDELYDESASALIAVLLDESQLTGELLEAFRDRRHDFRLHGQVCAGLYRVPDASGRSWPLALTFQVVSVRAGRRRRFGLNVLGEGPAGESLPHLYDRLGSIPWSAAVRWAQAVLAKLEQDDRRRIAEPVLARRVEGLLGGLARRLERRERARGRRTQHAEQRHTEGTRPTRMAMTDLRRADQGDLLVDTRRQTIVVVGDRGRAHIFSPSGKLVTSVRYPPTTIERRRRSGLWRPARPEEIQDLRDKVHPL